MADPSLMTWQTGLTGFLAGLVTAMVTSPVGVSGAVFLLPVKLSVLHGPSPAVTPTNLLFNVVSGPGALARYQLNGYLGARLQPYLPEKTLRLLPGTLAAALAVLYLIQGLSHHRNGSFGS